MHWAEFIGVEGGAWFAFDRGNIVIREPAPGLHRKILEVPTQLGATVQTYAGERWDLPARMPGAPEVSAAPDGRRSWGVAIPRRTAAAGMGVLGLCLSLVADSGWWEIAGIFVSTFGLYQFMAGFP
ncbi:hypothetical protein K2O51_33495 (plasmid) [Cupriavidus pinatubonensis]|uniref:hypothetical protein n=1 Tax=Cupriavidus pinatubonensis TaxID=248026 RepID=UPI001C736D94|nr:hypothetical protein [Cupriavidus pinatubonensis]QYY33766.1 hypothetical protein K2O51_33495 [Cupriavidus pinatubonensis]